MTQKYYQEELQHLRELAVEFARAHPALAPMLTGTSQDPDVERLLEATAFMTGMLREKLDDDFPEIIQGLMQLVFPHYLQPIPAAVMMAFEPKAGLMQSFTIPAQTEIDSVPVKDQPCRFRTCGDIEIHPLRITAVDQEEKIGQNPVLRIHFRLSGLTLDQWQPEKLRLHLPGAIGEAADLYALLDRHTVNIRFVPERDGRPVTFSGRDHLKNAITEDQTALVPYPGQSLSVFRLLQEYFILPEQFLFFDLYGWENWQDRGSGDRFAVEFELERHTEIPRDLKAERFALFVVPAVNLFAHDAVPISLDHRNSEYRIIPAGKDRHHYSVFSVEKVTGIVQGTVQKREYAPFEHFREADGDRGSYFIRRRISIHARAPEMFIGVGYPEENRVRPETLSIDLLCTNGDRPAALQAGDICRATSTSPELCTFKNIGYPTKMAHPPLDRNLLWNLLSHLSVNLLSIMEADSLQTLLRLYVFAAMQDQSVVQANLKRIQAISEVSCRPGNRVIRGGVIRGFEIEIKMNAANFASKGDFVLFSAVLDRFFAEYAAINSYTRLTVTDGLSGERTQWPIRIGKTRIH
ncbi:MAG: type VI secretion system baseplate subunit TssF [Desulfobacteraceae bacterium]|nr:type VI secretion system baseplate subunit TssF [Desulfobacteraceae bacterium]